MRMKDEAQLDKALLTTAGDSIEADMIEARLRESNIPVLREYREPGAFLNIALGTTTLGIDLYVPKDRLEEAKELIDAGQEVSEEEILNHPSFTEEAAKANDELIKSLDKKVLWIGAAFLAVVIFLIYLLVRG